MKELNMSFKNYKIMMAKTRIMSDCTVSCSIETALKHSQCKQQQKRFV